MDNDKRSYRYLSISRTVHKCLSVLECAVFVSTVCFRFRLYFSMINLIAARVALSLNRTLYSIFENDQVVTVTLQLNATYHEDIVVNVTVGELQGGCAMYRALNVSYLDSGKD